MSIKDEHAANIITDVWEGKLHPSEWLPELYAKLTDAVDEDVHQLGFRDPDHLAGGMICWGRGRLKQAVYMWRLANVAMACPFPRCKGEPSKVQAAFAADRMENPLGGGQFDGAWNEHKYAENKYVCPECGESLKYCVPLLGGNPPFWQWAGEEGGE